VYREEGYDVISEKEKKKKGNREKATGIKSLKPEPRRYIITIISRSLKKSRKKEENA
jgi:hypothetical protein